MLPRQSAEVEVTAVVPGHQQSGIRVHSARTLDADDVTQSEGIPVTAVPRTLLNVAAVAPWALGWALGGAEKLGLLDLISVDALIRRSSGRRGVARLRLGLDSHRDPAFTRSGLERSFLRLVKAAGLPKPSTNVFVEGYELDAYWPEHRFAVEIDAYRHHGDRRAFENDRIRHEDLKLAGIEMVRVTGNRIEREPASVVRRLRKLLDQRRPRG